MGGSIFSYLLSSNICDYKGKLLLLGLDGSGKTTIFNHLKGKPQEVIPTYGFNIEEIKFGYSSITCWDVGGAHNTRNLWRHYVANTFALIFVVDSQDRDEERIGEVRERMGKLLEEEGMAGCVVLVVANKQDQMKGEYKQVAMKVQSISQPMSVGEIRERLGLEGLLGGRKWGVLPCCGLNGAGIEEAKKWVQQMIKPSK